MAGEDGGGGAVEVSAAERLAELMERLAERDGAALFDLIEAHRSDLARTVRSIAGKRNARLRAGEVEELVTEAALAIADVAGAWKAGGAPPWVYAWGRIAEAVDRHIGQWSSVLDDATEDVDAAAPPPPAGSEPPVAEVLHGLAAERELVALLVDGLDRVASERDRLLFVDHGVQAAMGDPSPAVTVGLMYGMEPAAVRQQTRRVRLRLGKLSRIDPRYAELASLPIVA